MLLAQPGQFSFYKYSEEKEKQQLQEQYDIPMDIIKEQINAKFYHKGKRIYFLSAGTGAGKSSYFIVELLKMCGVQGMICTKPKQQLVMDPMGDLPKHYPHMIKGMNMGYKVGGKVELLPILPQSVLFMTTAILTNMIIEEKWEEIFKYKFIAIDEVHEMNNQMIQVLYFIKQFLNQFQDDPRCPLFICMSATMSLPKFIKYFDVDVQWYDIGLLQSQKSQFKREEYYFSKSQNSIVERLEEALQFVEKYYVKNKIYEKKFRDILIFCKNSIMIRMFEKYLENKKFSFKSYMFPYMQKDSATHSQNWIDFNSQMPGIVKIILSTNLVESGANIEGLYTVIDTGIRFTNIYNNIQRKSLRVSIPISKSTIVQRMGRVGRNSEGMFIGLYQNGEQFPEDDINPILIDPDVFSSIFLYIKYQLQHINTLQEFIEQKPTIDLQKIDLIEILSSDIIIRTYHQLIRLGLMKRNKEATVSLFSLVKLGHSGFVKILCMFFGCDPFETCLIQYMLSRPFHLKKPIILQEQFECFMRKDYSIFDIEEVILCYDSIGTKLSQQKNYEKIKFNQFGYKKVLWIISS